MHWPALSFLFMSVLYPTVSRLTCINIFYIWRDNNNTLVPVVGDPYGLNLVYFVSRQDTNTLVPVVGDPYALKLVYFVSRQDNNTLVPVVGDPYGLNLVYFVIRHWPASGLALCLYKHLTCIIVFYIQAVLVITTAYRQWRFFSTYSIFSTVT